MYQMQSVFLCPRVYSEINFNSQHPHQKISRRQICFQKTEWSKIG